MAQCPKGHEFGLETVETSFPLPLITTVMGQPGTLNFQVVAISCRFCGHVYGTVRVT